MGTRLSWDLGPRPAYRALEQSFGIALRIEGAERLDCLSRCFFEMRLVNSLSSGVASLSIFLNNIVQLS